MAVSLSKGARVSLSKSGGFVSETCVSVWTADGERYLGTEWVDGERVRLGVQPDGRMFVPTWPLAPIRVRSL